MNARPRIQPRPGVRPTTGKVMEALFQIVAGILGNLSGCRVLDVFAGTGQLGCTALELGAGEVVFVEKDREVASRLKRHLGERGLGPPVTRVVSQEATRALARLEGSFDLVLMDPPYGRHLAADALEVLAERGLLAPGGVCVVEHHHKDPLPPAIGDLVSTRTQRYGETALSFYARSRQGGTP